MIRLRSGKPERGRRSPLVPAFPNPSGPAVMPGRFLFLWFRCRRTRMIRIRRRRLPCLIGDPIAFILDKKIRTLRPPAESSDFSCLVEHSGFEADRGCPRVSHSVPSGHTMLPHYTGLSHYVPHNTTRLMVLTMVLNREIVVRLPRITTNYIYMYKEDDDNEGIIQANP